MKKYLCIHGHFYQPPRENPWIGVIEAQPSARPYHDWNERITRECYAPNGRSRVLDERMRIGRIINNYEHMSFNFGPTLLTWLEKEAPIPYGWILEGDRKSIARYNGHGNALAQVYNHMIMPLANLRDKATQVRWGLADFRKRFGRDPEGMWLAEAAVDTESLAVLADHGLRFVILSPEQAAKVRPIEPAKGEEEWVDVTGGRVDPRRPYRVFLDSARKTHIDVFFYDGPVSRAIAYERLLTSGAGFLARIQGAFGEENGWPRLVNLATDGESYGHHFKFGDMALAWVFNRLEKDDDIQSINYGAFLELHPPVMEARVVENSSWSCAHGVERWRSDCGCSVGGQPGWNQAWRAPLREGLDELRDKMAVLFEDRGSRLLKSPWEARNEYIDILLDPETSRDFIQKHASRELSQEETVEVFRLLEAQLMAMYMFTSCAWFFDDIAGLEPVQNMKYAARAIDLIGGGERDRLERDLLKTLARAVPNDKEYASGEEVYTKEVDTGRMKPDRAVAHFVLGRLVDETEVGRCPVARLVAPIRERRLSEVHLTVSIGRLAVHEYHTGRTEERSFLALDPGGAGLTCLIAPDPIDLEQLSEELKQALEEASAIRIMEAFNRALPQARSFVLSDLVPDTRTRLVRKRAQGFFRQLRQWVMENYQTNWEVLSMFRETGRPLAEVESLIFRTVVDDRLVALLEESRNPGTLKAEALKTLAAQAKAWGVMPESSVPSSRIRTFIKDKFKQIEQDPSPGAIADLCDFLDILRVHTPNLDLWGAQNIYYDLFHSQAFVSRLTPEAQTVFRRLGQTLNFSASPE